MRTGTTGRAFVAGLLLLPIAEIAVVIWVAGLIGIGPTVAVLAGLSLVGIGIVRRQGGRALGELRAASRERRHPEQGLADRWLRLVGGLLLVVPGFLTALLSVPFFLPFTRPALRAWVSAWAVRRGSAVVPPQGPQQPGPPRTSARNVVPGEVVDG